MQVKTFEGMSMQEVIRRIKKQFGADAVILSTKEKIIDGSNTKMVEVRAAVSEDEQRHGASSTGIDDGGYKEAAIANERLAAVERKLSHFSEKLATKQQLAAIEGSLKELKRLCLTGIQNISEKMAGQYPLYLEPIYQQLSLMGIEASFIVPIMNHLKSLPSFDEAKKQGIDSAEEYYRAHAIRFMFKKIKIYPPMIPTQGHAQIHLFVGGSGLGKTCTAAKIASYFTQQDKAKVLLVSFDNKKTSVSEQLPVYAKILDVPHVIMEEPDDLEKIILNHRQCELVLIDSMGGVPKTESQLKQLSRLVEKPLPMDVHLVLSLTENSWQMDRTINSFASLGLHSIIFTKLDESWSYGEMYNIACRWSLPLSFFTTGEKISEHLEMATRERVMERLFGL